MLCYESDESDNLKYVLRLKEGDNLIFFQSNENSA